MNESFIKSFFNWFIKRFADEAYRKMRVDGIKDWAGGDPSKDLVMLINRQRNVIEIESNYFHGLKAEFSLIEIGIRYERFLRELQDY